MISSPSTNGLCTAKNNPLTICDATCLQANPNTSVPNNINNK